jgi:hypothetical protein
VTPLERAAQAIVGARIGEPGYSGDWDEDDVKAARAVLTAIREPNEGMVEAGRDRCDCEEHQMEAGWQAMIDAALAEGASD